MAIKTKPYIQKHIINTNADKQMVSLKLNDDEKRLINDAQYLLRQTKVGSCIKMLMKIGYKSITTPRKSGNDRHNFW